jgi:hypothetical protein
MKTKSIRTNNSNIPSHWARSQPAHSNNRQFRTDGDFLYSYNLVVGVTVGGKKILLDYTAAAGHFRSQTTSQHIGVSRTSANQIMDVDVARCAGIIR